MTRTWHHPSNPDYKRKHVYFIGMRGHNIVKIGIAISVKDRKETLQSANPFDLYTAAVIHGGDAELEQELHRRFSAWHMRGEWFHICPEMLDYLDARPGAWLSWLDTSPYHVKHRYSGVNLLPGIVLRTGDGQVRSAPVLPTKMCDSPLRFGDFGYYDQRPPLQFGCFGYYDQRPKYLWMINSNYFELGVSFAYPVLLTGEDNTPVQRGDASDYIEDRVPFHLSDLEPPVDQDHTPGCYSGADYLEVEFTKRESSPLGAPVKQEPPPPLESPAEWEPPPPHPIRHLPPLPAESPKGSHWITPRAGVWWVFRSVPPYLRAELGTGTLARSLGTEDRSAAVGRAKAVLPEFDQQIREAWKRAEGIAPSQSSIESRFY